jgi:hypothetical protein
MVPTPHWVRAAPPAYPGPSGGWPLSLWFVYWLTLPGLASTGSQRRAHILAGGVTAGIISRQRCR